MRQTRLEHRGRGDSTSTFTSSAVVRLGGARRGQVHTVPLQLCGQGLQARLRLPLLPHAHDRGVQAEEEGDREVRA